MFIKREYYVDLIEQVINLKNQNFSLRDKIEELESTKASLQQECSYSETFKVLEENKRLSIENIELKDRIRENSLLYANNDMLNEYKTEINFSKITNLPALITIGDEQYIVHDVEKIN